MENHGARSTAVCRRSRPREELHARCQKSSTCSNRRSVVASKPWKMRIGIRIFERSRRSVVPTREGREVLLRAEELLRLAKELRESTERDRAELHGPFHFGCVSAVAAGILPLATSLFLGASSAGVADGVYGAIDLHARAHRSRRSRARSGSPCLEVAERAQANRSLQVIQFRLVVRADKKKRPPDAAAIHWGRAKWRLRHALLPHARSASKEDPRRGDSRVIERRWCPPGDGATGRRRVGPSGASCR